MQRSHKGNLLTSYKASRLYNSANKKYTNNKKQQQQTAMNASP